MDRSILDFVAAGLLGTCFTLLAGGLVGRFGRPAIEHQRNLLDEQRLKEGWSEETFDEYLRTRTLAHEAATLVRLSPLLLKLGAVLVVPTAVAAVAAWG